MMNFDFNVIMDLLIPHIVLGCLCLGYILKKWMPLDNKYIPTILLLTGALVAGFCNGWTLEFIVAGMLSALASTGLHQAFYQYMKIDAAASIAAEVEFMGPDEEVVEEKEEEMED